MARLSARGQSRRAAGARREIVKATVSVTPRSRRSSAHGFSRRCSMWLTERGPRT